MPIFTVPLHEFNHCHGEADGKFCSDPEPSDPLLTRGKTTKSTVVDAMPAGALDFKREDRPKTIAALADYLVAQYGEALGVEPHPVKIATVPPDMDMWNGGPGGFYMSKTDAENYRGHPNTPADADGDTLYLTGRTQAALTKFLDHPTTAAEKKDAVDAGLAVIAHELLHSQSPMARLGDTMATKAEGGPRDIYTNKLLEEGMASYLGGRVVQRLVPSRRYPLTNQGYDAGRTLWEETDRRAGPEFIRSVYRQTSGRLREKVLAATFPSVTKDNRLDRFTLMDAHGAVGPPNARKLVQQVLEGAATGAGDLLARVQAAPSRAALLQLKAEAHRRRGSLSTGQQFELMEQWALRYLAVA